MNQLTDLSGQALSYDANGNLLADGQRTFSWDAANRLIGITYPGQPGKRTAFAYDGLGRRTAIASTPAGGGSAVTTNYLWCGSRPCQARSPAGTVLRSYYDEGEAAAGGPYYYGIDQLGSVRRVFVSPTTAPSYDYDPYGNPLFSSAPLTDFGYAGMLNNVDSGLGLTWYRAYDPSVGRWLSRDPLGEWSDPAANLYRYVGGNPVSWVDPWGLASLSIYGYSGWGGGIVLYFNDNGQFSGVGFQRGIGIGGGISFDPLGSPPGPQVSQPSGSLSAFAQAGGNIGPSGACMGAAVGATMSLGGGQDLAGSLQSMVPVGFSDPFSVHTTGEGAWGFGWGVQAGGQFTFIP